jgi:ParB family chromosome partitioning protein
MKEQRPKMRLQSVDSLFTTQEERDNAKKDIVTNIPLELIHDFPNHPFKVTDNEEMDRLVESVSIKGVILPTVVRQKDDGSYEMISGHRRKHAAQKAGLKEIPCIIKDLTDDEATILMVDSNIQREHILPSEKAFAYKMKLEAMKHQGKALDDTSTPVVSKLRSDETLGEEVGESREQIRRYIRLTYLIPELMQLVDEERIAFRPAVEISYLSEDNQYVLQNIFEYDEATPSLSQAIRLKKLEQEGKLTEEKIEDIMMQEKPNQKEQYKASYDKLRQYFPSNYSNQQIDSKIIELLEKYQREWKNKNRDAR